MKTNETSVIKKFFSILKFEKGEISSIYFYAILAALIQLTLPLGIQSIISFVTGGAISTSLVLLIAFVITGVFLVGQLQVNQMKLIERIEQRIFVRYSFAYAITIPKLNLKEVDNYYLPEFVNRFFDTVSLQKGLSKLLLDLPAATIQILFGLLLLSFYHPVFIFFGILLLLVLYIILRITGTRGLSSSIEESDYKYKVAGYIEELARVINTFKLIGKSGLHVKKTDEYVKGYLKARTEHFNVLVFQYRTLIAIKVVITTAMLVIGAILLIDQQLNIGQFIAAEIVILMIIGSIEKLIINLDSVYDVLTSVEKINKVIDKPKDETGKIVVDNNVTGFSIQLNQLSFAYVPDKYVLKQISLDIQAGEKVCITGAFSSGKSTLLKIMSGLYLSFEGSYKINNIPLQQYDLHSLHQSMGILLDTEDILHGSLKENIVMANSNIAIAELDELASITGLKPFVDAHEDGYEMMINPTGQHLSRKIVKKILLLRALAQQPRLLLLEEPWLELEEKYTERLQDYLLNTLENTTVVVVSNDASFASQCTRVFHLEDGVLKS